MRIKSSFAPRNLAGENGGKQSEVQSYRPSGSVQARFGPQAVSVLPTSASVPDQSFGSLWVLLLRVSALKRFGPIRLIFTFNPRFA